MHLIIILCIIIIHNIFNLVNEILPSVTEALSLGQYYSIDCITGPIPTGVSVSWILTNGSIYNNTNTLVISSILPYHNNTKYTCIIEVVNNPSDCIAQLQTITLRVKGNKFYHF